MKLIATLTLMVLALLGVQISLHMTGVPRRAWIQDAPHQPDGGALCFLGAFATVVRRDQPGLTYREIVRYANPARVESGTVVLDEAARQLGYRVEVTATDEPLRARFLEMLKTTGTPGALHPNPDAAFLALRSLVARGIVPVAHVDLYYIQPERRAASPQFQDMGHAPHFLPVVGYDAERVYVHDSQREEAFARYLPLRISAFMEAWAASGHVLLVIRRGGERVPEEQAWTATLAAAGEAARVLREKARRAERRGRLEDTLFLPSMAYRRLALADWLDERGKRLAATRYRALATTYQGFLPSGQVAQDVARLRIFADGEEQAARLIDHAGAGR